jgi:thioredoxin 1
MFIALIVVGVVVVGFLVLLYFSFRQLKKMPVMADHERIKTLMLANFDQQTRKGIAVVDFWAPWCGPCKMMGPILNELADAVDGKVTIGKVNVDNEMGLAQRFQVRNIPTLLILRNGEVAHRFTGIKSKDFLLQQIQELL